MDGGGYSIPGLDAGGGYPIPGVWMGGGYSIQGLDGGYPIPGLDGGYPIPGVWMGGGYSIPGLDGGYPIPGLDGGTPLLGTPPNQETDQQSKHLLRGGRCASCVHAGGLSCPVFDYLPMESKLSLITFSLCNWLNGMGDC